MNYKIIQSLSKYMYVRIFIYTFHKSIRPYQNLPWSINVLIWVSRKDLHYDSLDVGATERLTLVLSN